jgi:hypothetical protein
MVLRELHFGGGFARSGNQGLLEQKDPDLPEFEARFYFCELWGRSFSTATPLSIQRSMDLVW